MTRDAILREAMDATTTGGFAGLALREIARHLKVTLPAIQRHFPTKDDLWRACVDALIDAVPLRAHPPDVVDPAAALIDHIRYQIESAALLPAITAAMWNDAEPGAAERLAYMEEKVSVVLAQARERFAIAMEAGVVRTVDPEVFLALVSLGLSSLASSRYALARLFAIDLDDPASRERFAACLTDLVMNGLLVPRR